MEKYILAGIFIVVYFGFVLIIQRLVSKKSHSLSTTEIALAFAWKVLLGCAYGYIFFHYYGGDDTWELNQSSIQEYEKLIQQPLKFLTDLNPLAAFERNSSFHEGFTYYLWDLEFWLITKPLALFYFISQGNYYVNVLFFNFITFWGHYLLFRLLLKEFPQKRKILFFVIFLFPPAIFWLSGIRADGMLFLSLATVFANFKNLLDHIKLKSVFFFCMGLIGILIFRSVWVMLLIPTVAGWYFTVKFNKNPWFIFSVVCVVSMILFFGSMLMSAKNLPAIVVNKQQEFLNLQANTTYQLDSLHADVRSFAFILPQAAKNVFLRPYVWEVNGPLQLLSAAEVIFFWLIFLGLFIRPDKNWRVYIKKPLIPSFIFFGFFLFLFIGYTVPFPGAIVRYKIIGELLLLLGISILINWESGSDLRK